MPKTYPAELRLEARRLRAQALYVTEIAERLGVSQSTVSAWTRDVGLRLAAEASVSSRARLAEVEELRTRAISLRQRGLSTTQIARELGIRVSSTLSGWLVGTAPPDWTKRPRAKDGLRVQARQLRAAGRTYAEIAAELDVSKSTVSLWVRDLPAPHHDQALSAHARHMGKAYWIEENARRDVVREEVKAEAVREIGELTPRELLLVGTALYWAEGSKDKTYRRRERLVFINSDASVIRTYLAWLDVMGVDASRRSYRLSIHESASLAAATEFWSATVGVPGEEFRRPALKRHNAATVRLNVGEDYHGCLIVEVSRSRVEYQRMEGIFRAISRAAPSRTELDVP